MKLSWSHKLFLRINALVGKNPQLDKLMYFFGFWLIYFCLGAFGIFVLSKMFVSVSLGLHIFLTYFLSVLLAYAVSYTIAWIWPHARPEKELPQVKKLFRTIGTWKSFPSDHTTAVSLVACVVSLFSSSGFLVTGFFVAASCVAMGRVYSGVHYPRDIVGGIGMAVISVLLVSALF